MNISVNKITYSKRKTLSVEINSYGELHVRAPKNTSQKLIENFIMENNKWILKRKNKIDQNSEKLKKFSFNTAKRDEYLEIANNVLKKRLDYISQKIDINYKKFRLSNAKKRWGSCSTKGSISINWRLIFTPEEIIDYIILHELAHIKHSNHSKKFWYFIQRYNPNYNQHRKKLKDYEYLLLID